jgi:hypothetical protein
VYIVDGIIQQFLDSRMVSSKAKQLTCNWKLLVAKEDRMNITKRTWQIFLQVATVFSFMVNIALIIVVLRLAPLLSEVDLDDPDGPSVQLDLQLDVPLDISHPLPIHQDTVVQLTQRVPLYNLPATFSLPGSAGSVNGTIAIALPAGMNLPIRVDTTVPVEATIPMRMDVPVKITLSSDE